MHSRRWRNAATRFAVIRTCRSAEASFRARVRQSFPACPRRTGCLGGGLADSSLKKCLQGTLQPLTRRTVRASGRPCGMFATARLSWEMALNGVQRLSSTSTTGRPPATPVTGAAEGRPLRSRPRGNTNSGLGRPGVRLAPSLSSAIRHLLRRFGDRYQARRSAKVIRRASPSAAVSKREQRGH